MFGKLTKLDEGKFGVVYKAKNSKTNEIVAVKVIPVTKDVKQENLVDEIKLLKACNNKNVVKFNGSYETKGNIWVKNTILSFRFQWSLWKVEI